MTRDIMPNDTCLHCGQADAEARAAHQVREALAVLVQKLEAGRLLGLRINFGIGPDAEGKFSSYTAEILKVID